MAADFAASGEANRVRSGSGTDAMPSVLIDSCALLWATGEPARLGPDAREVIADARSWS